MPCQSSHKRYVAVHMAPRVLTNCTLEDDLPWVTCHERSLKQALTPQYSLRWLQQVVSSAEMLNAKPAAPCRVPTASTALSKESSRRRRVTVKSMTANTQLVELEQKLREQALQEQAPLQLTVVPYRHHKVLHLIRHGEGYHNVAGRRDHSLYSSWEYEDAHLTEFGWQQAQAVQQHIKATGIKVDVVVVSPLKRAIQTAVGCFGNYEAKPLNGTPPLMLELTDEPGKVTAHPAVSSSGCPPFICYELCREHLGVHPCDKRGSVQELQALFPAVDFSLLDDAEDQLWQQHHRETKEEIKARGRAFMAQIMARPETHIAIVSHSSFLHFMMTNFGGQASTTVQGELHRWFENCELRSVVVADEQSTCAGHDLQHFPGFAASVKEGPSV